MVVVPFVNVIGFENTAMMKFREYLAALIKELKLLDT